MLNTLKNFKSTFLLTIDTMLYLRFLDFSQNLKKFYEAILPRLSAKGGDENTHLPTFPWKRFGYILTQLQPVYLASNQPAARF